MALTKVTYSMIDGSPINVLDYGADPSGVNDSTAAIQAAVNAGSVINFPYGSYKFGRIVKTTGDLLIEGNNSTFNTVKYANGVNAGCSQQFFDFTNMGNVILRNFTCDGGQGTSTAIIVGADCNDDGIGITNSGNIVIDGVTVTGWSSGVGASLTDSHAIWTSGNNSVLVQNCIIEYVSKEGIHDLDSKRVTYQNNYAAQIGYSPFSFSGSDGVRVHHNQTFETGVNSNSVSLMPWNRSYNVDISNNLFDTHGNSFATPYDSAYGAPGVVIHNDATATSVGNINISNNFFNKMRYGIFDELVNAQKIQVTISNNQFSLMYEAIQGFVNTTSFVIANNSFKSLTRAIYVIDAVGTDKTFIGNVFTGLSGAAITFTGDSTGVVSSQIIVANNFASGCTDTSYTLNNLGNSVVQNNVAVTGSGSINYHYAISASAPDVVIQNNTAKGTVTIAPYSFSGPNSTYRLIRFNVGYGEHTIGNAVVGSSWDATSKNGCVLKLGGVSLWVDSTYKLRINPIAPTSDTDGTVVGTQT